MVGTSCSTAIKLNHWHATSHAAKNSTYHQRTIPKLISYLHAIAGSQPVKTWCKYAVTEIIQINMTMEIHLTGCYKNSVIF